VAGVKQIRCEAPAEEARLAASVAHEISNPLGSLLDLLFMLEAEPALTENGRHCLMLAGEEVRRLSQIAESVLHHSGDGTVPRDANVPQLLASAVDFYQPRLEAHGISIKTRYCLDGNLAVYAGPLRQVFSNLLLNAVDAMPGGGRLEARVSIAHEWSGQRRQGLRVTVADTGCGVTMENLGRIFEPCFTTKGRSGNGLGLSLVKEVVQKHGGSLRVRSSTTPGHSGSVFTIFLPSA
jgi:signal transduction histidine kinase